MGTSDEKTPLEVTAVNDCSLDSAEPHIKKTRETYERSRSLGKGF